MPHQLDKLEFDGGYIVVEDILEYIFSVFFGDKIKDARDEIGKKENKFARIALTIFLFFIVLLLIAVVVVFLEIMGVNTSL